MIIAVTGHRPAKLNKEYDYNGPCSDFVRDQLTNCLLDKKPTLGISGMALGADTIFAQVCLKHKIPLLAAIPFKNQEARWSEQQRKLYYSLLDRASDVVVVSPGDYSLEKMQIRNQYMVDRCDTLIAVFDGTKGGTKNTVQYALQQHKPIIYIDPNEFDRKPQKPSPVLFY